MLQRFDKMFRVDPLAPDYEPPPQRRRALARARGVSPFEVVYEWMMADGGNGIPTSHLQLQLRRLLAPAPAAAAPASTMLSLGDGGAHVGYMTDAGLPTFMLTWTRDRSRGPTLPLEDIVRRQTHHTASIYGLSDRGLLPRLQGRPEPDRLPHLAATRPAMAYDLPGGGKRLLQKTRGHLPTVVSGVPTHEHGRGHRALPGSCCAADAFARSRPEHAMATSANPPASTRRRGPAHRACAVSTTGPAGWRLTRAFTWGVVDRLLETAASAHRRDLRAPAPAR